MATGPHLRSKTVITQYGITAHGKHWHIVDTAKEPRLRHGFAVSLCGEDLIGHLPVTALSKILNTVDVCLKCQAMRKGRKQIMATIETPAAMAPASAPDRQLAIAVLDVLLSVSATNADHGTTNPMIPRVYYDGLRKALNRVWPGAYDRGRAFQREMEDGKRARARRQP
jgi:hypothetical protein